MGWDKGDELCQLGMGARDGEKSKLISEKHKNLKNNISNIKR